MLDGYLSNRNKPEEATDPLDTRIPLINVVVFSDIIRNVKRTNVITNGHLWRVTIVPRHNLRSGHDNIWLYIDQ